MDAAAQARCGERGVIAGALIGRGELFFVFAVRLQNEVAHSILRGQIGNRAQQREAAPCR